jgi:dolichol kinase
MAGGTATVRRAIPDEFARRLVHASGSVLPALYVFQLASWVQVRVLFVVGAVIATVLELFRLFGGLDWTIYDLLIREYEQDNPAGYAYYMLSTASVVLVFGPQIAIPAALMLMIGDPISGMAGSGEFRAVKRPIALAVMFVTCVALSAPFLYETPLAVALGGVVAMVADGVKLVVSGYVIDDNLTIPLAAAGAMWAGVELSTALL